MTLEHVSKFLKHMYGLPDVASKPPTKIELNPDRATVQASCIVAYAYEIVNVQTIATLRTVVARFCFANAVAQLERAIEHAANADQSCS